MGSSKRWSNIAYPVLFLGPMLILFISIKILPLIYGVLYSFTDWNGISSSFNFIGLGNFKDLLKDSQNFVSLRFTFLYAVTRVILINMFGFFFAYFLCKKIIARNFLRASFYIPNVIGGLILGFIWKFIFIQSFPSIAQYSGIGFFSLPWLGNPATAFWGIIIVDIWQNMGYMMVIYIAGITSIPKDFMEAARIDGASSLQVLWHIILPMVMPAITQCLFISALGAFKLYELNYALTGGGPFRSSEAFTLNIYITAFSNNKMGLGAAKSLVFILIIVFVTQIQVFLSRRKEVQL